MSPKEKAKELVNKMMEGFQFTIDEYTAKQCALIAVDETIKELQSLYHTTEYWQEVKREIKKL